MVLLANTRCTVPMLISVDSYDACVVLCCLRVCLCFSSRCAYVCSVVYVAVYLWMCASGDTVTRKSSSCLCTSDFVVDEIQSVSLCLARRCWQFSVNNVSVFCVKAFGLMSTLQIGLINGLYLNVMANFMPLYPEQYFFKQNSIKLQSIPLHFFTA